MYVMILLSGVHFIPWYDTSWRVPHAEQVMFTLPEHLILRLVFIEIISCCPVICVTSFHVIFLFLDFEFWLFLLFGCVISLYFLHIRNLHDVTWIESICSVFSDCIFHIDIHIYNLPLVKLVWNFDKWLYILSVRPQYRKAIPKTIIT